MFDFIKDVIKLMLVVTFKFPYRLIKKILLVFNQKSDYETETHYHAFHNNAEHVYVGISKGIRKALDKFLVSELEESNNEFDKALITKWHEEYSRLLDELESGKINQNFLSLLIFSAKNKEEAIGDLVEYNEYMKESGYSKFRRIITIAFQIIMINSFQIKTKIENVFSNAKKIGSLVILMAIISLGVLNLINSSSSSSFEVERAIINFEEAHTGEV